MITEDPKQNSSSSLPELSVVVLCYRAGEYARQFVSQLSSELEASGIDYELVLVGNFLPDSNDKTPEIIKDIAQSNPRCHAVAREKEGMMGWDMRSGLETATGRHLAVIDGDGQMPTSDIVKVYRMLEVGHYDIVKTFRAQRFDGFYRKNLSGLYNMLFRILFPSASMLRDINSKPKVMTRETYEKMDLISNDWFTDAEIMIEALRNEEHIGEVSTIFYENERRSSFVPISAIFEFLGNLLYYRFFRKW